MHLLESFSSLSSSTHNQAQIIKADKSMGLVHNMHNTKVHLPTLLCCITLASSKNKNHSHVIEATVEAKADTNEEIQEGECRKWRTLFGPLQAWPSYQLTLLKETASRRQLKSMTHIILAGLWSRCYYRDGDTGAWELSPSGARTASSNQPSDSWTALHNPTSATMEYVLIPIRTSSCTIMVWLPTITVNLFY